VLDPGRGFSGLHELERTRRQPQILEEPEAFWWVRELSLEDLVGRRRCGERRRLRGRQAARCLGSGGEQQRRKQADSG
jgi:hypothetical protein